MSTRHFSAERTRRNGASISSGGSIARNRQRHANLATSNSPAISSHSIAKTCARAGGSRPRDGRHRSWIYQNNSVSCRRGARCRRVNRTNRSRPDCSWASRARRKGDERDRRPTQDELDRIILALEANVRQQIPVGRIIRFAVATAMRQDEIARIEWRDFDASRRMLLIRNRKDPRKKKGNDQRIPLLEVSGYDACKIIEEQGRFSNIREGRIFPYNGRSVGTAFRRECGKLKIKDLHFHDLRHEGTSRLFETGFSIEQVALVTGHKDWKMLRRYTHLKPETLHSISSVRVA